MSINKEVWQRALTIGAGCALVFLSLYNLPHYPKPWYDEGSHLHVPKTLVRLGEYADYSSEGFRYYGPTVGVGPTVMLPIAAAFELFGIGLLQARLVMVIYLLAAVWLFFGLAQWLGGRRLAWAATALFVTSRAVALLEYGRQVLGEVPGLCLVVGGLWLWFSAWERASWRRLVGVGLLLGLATITKNQYFLVLAPTVLLAWFANLLYYRSAPQRVFLVPGILIGVAYGLWQVYLLAFLGPGNFSDNLAQFREFTAGAALVFRTDLMARGIQELLDNKVHLGALVPALMYGMSVSLPRRHEGQQWGLLWLLMVFNLIWYIVGSVSWLRYAFPALAFSCLFVARFFHDLTDGFQFDGDALWAALRRGQAMTAQQGIRWALWVWLAAIIMLPLAQTSLDIIRPPFNGAAAMTAYLNETVPHDVLIETWEPEMGFLTDHRYHYPPQILLNTAVAYKWLGGKPPSDSYTFVQTERPPYILEGEFARWVDMYAKELQGAHYQLVATIGDYKLYALKP
jgi:hypothetical protein